MPPKTTTERGLGWDHRKQRERLLRNHVDGTVCWWCARPMYREAAKNWDGKPLEADHSLARSHGGTKADRLLCSTCNRQRQDGRNDHLRPAVTGMAVAEYRAIDEQLGVRLMPWP